MARVLSTKRYEFDVQDGKSPEGVTLALFNASDDAKFLTLQIGENSYEIADDDAPEVYKAIRVLNYESSRVVRKPRGSADDETENGTPATTDKAK